MNTQAHIYSFFRSHKMLPLYHLFLSLRVVVYPVCVPCVCVCVLVCINSYLETYPSFLPILEVPRLLIVSAVQLTSIRTI